MRKQASKRKEISCNVAHDGWPLNINTILRREHLSLSSEKGAKSGLKYICLHRHQDAIDCSDPQKNPYVWVTTYESVFEKSNRGCSSWIFLFENMD